MTITIYILLPLVICLGLVLSIIGYKMMVEDAKDWGWLSVETIMGMLMTAMGIVTLSVAGTLTIQLYMGII